MRVSRTLALNILAAALLIPASAPAQEASLPDIEDEVMCPICGTLLELSEAPQADRQRVFIRRLIGEGRSKEEIKDALVAEYGEEVLAAPQGSGFDLTAYVVPIAAFLLAAAALVAGVWRWRRSASAEAGSATATPQGKDAERLESDLARYDL
jgi:cytochrome c-type biogenesis protein CcmH